MSDSTVRVIFLGDSAGARKAASDMDKAFSGSMKSVEGAANSATSAVVGGFQKAAKVAAIAGGVIAATIAGGLIAATGEAISFDAAMRNVNSIAQLSEGSYQKLNKQVLALSKSTGQGPTTLAKGLYDIYSSGIKGAGALDVLKQSAIAATAGLSDTQTASQVIVSALNSFQIPAKDANRVASDLFETVNKGIVNFPELATSFGEITGLAPDLGVSLQTVTGAFAALTLKSGNSARAATQTQAIFSSLLKPSKDLGTTIKDLGYANATTALQSLTLPQLLDQIRQKADDNNTSISKLFPNVRALGGFLGLTGKNAKAATDAINANNKAYQDGDEQNRAFLEQQKSIAVQWNLSKAAIEAAAVPLGAVFFPALRDVLNEGAKFADFLTKLDAHKTITAKLDFAWNGVKEIASHLWQQLSDALTGDSTKHVMVGTSEIAFHDDGQGLASKFWDYLQAQLSTTPTRQIHLGGQGFIDVKSGDTTLRDQFVAMVNSAVQGVDWGPVGTKVGQAIGKSIRISAAAFDAFAQTATNWANQNSGQLANVGAVIGLKVISTLLDPSFWIQHWALIGGILITIIPGLDFESIGVKVADEMFSLFGKTAGNALLAGLEHLPYSDVTTAFTKGLGTVIEAVATDLVKYSGKLVDAVISGIGKGFGKLGGVVKLALNTGVVAAIGGVIGAAVTKTADLGVAVVGEIEKWPGQIEDLGKSFAITIGNQMGNVPGLLTDPLATIGTDIINLLVDAFTGLGSAIASKIESEITGIHIPAPHVKLGHVGAGPISIPYPSSISFNARGGVIDRPELSMIGEDAPRHPEFIIPTNPAYRDRAKGLLSHAASALGVRGFAAGGGPGAGFGAKELMPREAHAKKSPNRPMKPVKGATPVTGPPGAKELAGVLSDANAAIGRVTAAGQAVSDATSNYDLTSRSLDQVTENFLLTVPDDPTDPTNLSTHQIRNEHDISQRLGQITVLESIKGQIITLMQAQEGAINDAVAKLQALVKQLLADIDNLKTQIEAAQQVSAAARQEEAKHVQLAAQYRREHDAADKAKAADHDKIAVERAKKKPNETKIKAWELDAHNREDDAKSYAAKAVTEDAAAKNADKQAKSSDANIKRLQAMITTRVDKIKDYNGDIADQRSNLTPQAIPYNVASAQLDIVDLQNEAASVSGTTGTLPAPLTPTDVTSADTSAADAQAADDQAALVAALTLNQQLRNALGLQSTQLSVIGGAAGFAKGSLFVPDTGIGLLHRGETILTSDQTAARSGGARDSAPHTVNVTFGSEFDHMGVIHAAIDGATDRISLNLGKSSDRRVRSNAH